MLELSHDLEGDEGQSRQSNALSFLIGRREMSLYINDEKEGEDLGTKGI